MIQIHFLLTLILCIKYNDQKITFHVSICCKSNNDFFDLKDTAPTQENGWYHSTKEPKNFAKDPVDSQGEYRYCGDDVPIIVTENEAQNDFWKRREMSLLRRFCLALSALFCLATVLVFLYALPCDNTVICPPVMENQPIMTWEKTLEGVGTTKNKDQFIKINRKEKCGDADIKKLNSVVLLSNDLSIFFRITRSNFDRPRNTVQLNIFIARPAFRCEQVDSSNFEGNSSRGWSRSIDAGKYWNFTLVGSVTEKVARQH